MINLVPTTKIILSGVLFLILSPIASAQVLFDAPGYVHTGNVTACFTYMGEVDFTSAYRFTPNTVYGTDDPSSDYYLNGYSIPLVADLNHDGYPEIVALGVTANNSSGRYNGIRILNGQTGQRIAKLPFKQGTADISGYFEYNNYHPSPSPIALVDSDRDGIIEVIMAFPNGGTATSSYRSTLSSYEIVPDGATYTLREKWHSSTNYNAPLTATSDYHKPIPTVVDLDGDGIPEVVVYNKIYNAVNGHLLATLETLGTDAFIGRDPNMYDDDKFVGFNYVYDLDMDGVYDVAAGGKVYKITAGAINNGDRTFNYTTHPVSSTPVDTPTGVADINGDGIPDVVCVFVERRSSSSGRIMVVVWNPGFLATDGNGNIVPGNLQPQLLAMQTFGMSSGTDGNFGSNSYVYIGDIDGREQVVNGKTYRLPEIAILSGKYRYAATTGSNPSSPLGIHPNIPSGSFPTSDASSGGSTSGREGDLIGFTWDASDGLNYSNRLKLSFVLEHDDQSTETGFTMFDFDNDGVLEICYRDEQYLRIIKPVKPFIKLGSTTAADGIVFREAVKSGTGFEYPVIADIDNDASAEMVVMGHPTSDAAFNGFVYAVGNGTGGKFAPALPVWNQFMYDPFKIDIDLKTPTAAEGRHAINRLDPEFTFRREIKDVNNQVVKTIEAFQPFNGTLIQAPYFTADTPALFPQQKLKFEPIVYKTAAYIIDAQDADPAKRPRIVTGPPYYAEITIGNWAGSLSIIPRNTPITVYRNNLISQATYVNKYPLSSPDLRHETSPGSGTFAAPTNSFAGIQPGGEIRIRIPITDVNDVYWVRLADDSGGSPWIWRFGLDDDPLGTESNPGLGIGVARRQYRDCDWEDQSVRVSKYRTFDDAATVQEYHPVKIDILDNDFLPDYSPYDFYLGLTLSDANITMQPKAGYLTYSGSGHNAAVEYHHDGRVALTAGIDSFQYSFTFSNPEYNPAQNTTVTSMVYIYVLESSSVGFSACYGSNVTVSLAEKPAGGITFNWFDEDGHPLGTGLSRTITMGDADSVYMIHPIVSTGAYTVVDFPNGELTVALVNSSGSTATMRWTGLVNHDWKNPGNWVEVKGGYETPVAWAPTGCVDVIIPSGATNYPELIDPMQCRNIIMKDRAMLKNPHVLTYSNASVELKLTPWEKDRFIMWSAPLKDMYSGDYHFTKADGTPNWGDVYMMFFQMPNPDVQGSAPVANNLTATFGNPGKALPLGSAFNFRLAATSINRDSVLTFPRTAATYTSANNTMFTGLTRLNGHRFITDGITLSGNQFNIPVPGNMGVPNRFLQIVNPYMAYLDAGAFLNGNSAILEASGYIEWDGSVSSGLIGHRMNLSPDGMRYEWISSAPAGTSSGMIPPLKSFFVMKKANVPDIPLKMSPAWTTTTGVSNPYTLRASPDGTETNILRIKATQGDKESYAILCYSPRAHPYYDGSEDVYQLFYDDIALTVYALTPWKDALSIYADGDFSTRDTDLGLRIRDAGEITLEFSGMATFGHNVWLVDRVAGKEIDLRQQSSYTFAAGRAPGSGVLELNDRFAIRASYTGEGITGNRAITLPRWNVSSADRAIVIQSTSLPIGNLHIYDVTGALVYSAGAPSAYFRIPLAQGIYIIKAQVGIENKVEKVFVK
ncbi:MAG: T9SS type A sorting domain-containing protein [Tannerellaceae bacterium]|jgi:hypothetical protein|nr:T9SS type A sorting domain-containing protein [Tannerellaceae bacterium]